MELVYDHAQKPIISLSKILDYALQVLDDLIYLLRSTSALAHNDNVVNVLHIEEAHSALSKMLLHFSSQVRVLWRAQ